MVVEIFWSGLRDWRLQLPLYCHILVYSSRVGFGMDLTRRTLYIEAYSHIGFSKSAENELGYAFGLNSLFNNLVTVRECRFQRRHF